MALQLKIEIGQHPVEGELQIRRCSVDHQMFLKGQLVIVRRLPNGRYRVSKAVKSGREYKPHANFYMDFDNVNPQIFAVMLP